MYFTAEITVPTGKWIKGNYKQVGYYRVHYDQSNWKKLSQQLIADLKVK
jgi:hypothetical protein